MPEMRRLSSSQTDFAARLAALTSIEQSLDEAVERRAAEILADVRSRGDAAVIEYTARFDGLSVAKVADLEIPRASLAQALETLDPPSREALLQAAARVRAYHERQVAKS